MRRQADVEQTQDRSSVSPPTLTAKTKPALGRKPLPDHLPTIERGRPGPNLLAHVLVSKYCDHLPLHRQSDIFAREGIDLDRSTLAGWVGAMAALLKILIDRIGAHVRAGETVHADDTPVPVLIPDAARPKPAASGPSYETSGRGDQQHVIPFFAFPKGVRRQALPSKIWYFSDARTITR